MRFFIIILLGFLIHSAQAQTMKVMTYNIRLDLLSDGPNKWDNRKESMADLINYYAPEIFGIQEGLPHQVAYLNNELKTYNYIGCGREDGKNKGEYSALFYDSTKYTVSHDTTIWLNETGKIGKRGWDAACPRICTYGLFENKANHMKVWVFNTHFDHKGVLARQESARLILSTIKKANSENLPVILSGDFNLTPDTDPILTIKAKMDDTYDVSKKAPYGPKGTFSGFDSEKVLNDKIDYIFVNGFEVESVRHIDDRRNDNYFVSDHLPVFSVLKVK